MCLDAESSCTLRLVCMVLYTACAVTQKVNKIFNFTGNTVRKQTSQKVRFSANL
jgi:hypothetical protein